MKQLSAKIGFKEQTICSLNYFEEKKNNIAGKVLK